MAIPDKRDTFQIMAWNEWQALFASNLEYKLFKIIKYFSLLELNNVKVSYIRNVLKSAGAKLALLRKNNKDGC
jgi:hypothetical protein